LIALAKAQPGKLNFASSGTGTSLHLAAELFRLSAGSTCSTSLQGRCAGPNGRHGGQAQIMFNVLPSALPQIKAGKLKVLASRARRAPSRCPTCRR